MGKISKAQEAEQRRKYMQELRRKEQQAEKRKSRLMWQIVIIAIVLVVAISAVVIALTVTNKEKNDDGEPTSPPTMEDLDFSSIDASKYTTSPTETNYVKMNVNYVDKNGDRQSGDIIIRLYEEVAPITVKNFKSLVANKYYDNSTFHRVVENFMIQGGIPATGQVTASIKGEFSDNGVVNNLLHERGVVSMARTSEPDSASGQFFIMHKKNTQLDGQYAAFGYVVSGMDVVDGIANTEVKINPSMQYEVSKPVNTVTITYMTFVTPK